MNLGNMSINRLKIGKIDFHPINPCGLCLKTIRPNRATGEWIAGRDHAKHPVDMVSGGEVQGEVSG